MKCEMLKETLCMGKKEKKYSLTREKNHDHMK